MTMRYLNVISIIEVCRAIKTAEKILQVQTLKKIQCYISNVMQ